MDKFGLYLPGLRISEPVESREGTEGPRGGDPKRKEDGSGEGGGHP